jgi:hypothetical protein
VPLRRSLPVVTVLALAAHPAASAQTTDSVSAARPAKSSPSRFGVEGYGIINYYNYDWQTDPKRRDAIDLERLVIEPSFRVNERLRFDADIEIEHGGTGVTLEFDPFEEFGEFEQEVEKGGEIVVEKLQLTYSWSPALNLRAGRMYVPVGLVTSNEEPDEYFTAARNEAESALIPTIWHETGVGLFGTLGRLRYQGAVITGLDATGFSSATWVRRGHQERFETVNANNVAAVGRLDLDVASGATVGVSGYFGNSAGNRPKADLNLPANVAIVDAHATLARGPLRARGLLMFGHLQNAGEVSAANRNLSNNLNVKRTPVGSEALAWFVEAGYDVLRLFRPAVEGGAGLDLFLRYDWYDTQHAVDDGVFDTPRWERHVVTTGVNWRPDPHLVVKGEYSRRTLGLATANREQTVALGVAFLYGE